MLTIQNLKSKIAQSPYQAYVYSYPHKTAYRPLTPPVYLPELWAQQDRQALFLYIHIPFCEMRCGFCNLFTTVSHNEDFMSQYVRTLQRQAQRMKAVLGDASFARFAIGGGTPTQLPIQHLETILNIAENTMGAKLQKIPISVEVSPETATEDKLKLLRSHAVDRVSIGVQSFIDSEVLATQRRQSTTQVEATLTRIKEMGFPTLNIDLIYGLPGQTLNSWLQSIQATLRFQPEEIYLYPLYVRSLTGLGRTEQEWDDIRLACYREGRSLLLSEGYTQVSMRMFRRLEEGQSSNLSPSSPSPVYCCQADGMIGLGCGARSYTNTLHYSNEYAVGAKGISEILQAYIQTADESFDYAHYGFQLNAEEQRRRYILLSLLSDEGLNCASYRQQFGSEVYADFPDFSELLALNLAIKDEDILQLTEFGIERSDTIGAWLFSEKVQELMQDYELK
ncbi:STM4012 family radical SAM protein [Nostoc sp. 'Peltigera malacea cyanobiont' DB3992]|uniref:STM4012 family radical SAM protein n=1 Tax=Nostoc sp. 'Peltigera malacea cyanobiont' DB3992 TaxID=1206980 RepID=UPI000C03FF19|nr:STM4012 family radical SAM protein [Nostoc sp. 'Peltigera malacea cyanobiont' DB3992]PHM09504.1 coproporphyrinogen III oxidase [Nostoc sp. 'Peltigera malacea cyanobiont' DB3992]